MIGIPFGILKGARISPYRGFRKAAANLRQSRPTKLGFIRCTQKIQKFFSGRRACRDGLTI